MFVRERKGGRLPALSEVRLQVEREFTADRRQRQLEAIYAKLLGRYQVVIEKRVVVPQVPEAPSSQPQEAGK